MCEFAHLHCHTQYSLLDGAAPIKDLIGRAQQMGMPAVGITDHGNLFGVPEFYTGARKAGIQPVIGSEFYVTPAGMDDTSDRTRYHQVLFAKDEEGYRNLIKLSSLSYTDGFYYKPRIDHQALRQYSGGLVATTCCLQGEVLQTILKKGEDAAKPIFRAYLDIFGDDYYIEIQDHGIPDQRKCNEVLLRWAKEFGVKVVATNDVHYVNQQDAEAQDVLLCLQTGKDYHDPNRMRFENDQFYLKSLDQMDAALSGVDERVRREAMTTTLEIAQKCDFELPMGKLLMPHYPLPDEFGSDMDAYLRHLVYQTARPRYGDPLPQRVVERLDMELGIIRDMGYAGYFLIVQDFTTAARELDVRVGPGRGSAAGSAVAYCLGITNIDPLQYDLLFERFLNPERVSMPDIDIDFDDRGRAKVIDYVVQKYGRENVCQIITYGTMGAKSVIRDVSRVLQIPLDEADRIAKMIPDGAGVSLESARQDNPDFDRLFSGGERQVQKMLHYASVLEGSARHTGVHAAGVIIAPGDVSEYVPVAVAKSKGEKTVTTQYDGNWVEEFGLLKMDFLGLKTLTVIEDALALIQEHHGVDIDIDAIPLDDDKTFELYQRGETVATFQFESSGMREWLRKLKPTSLDDLIAMNALYRPGPMDYIPDYIDRKHGRTPVEYPHPSLEGILKPSYGIPIYQEQVMQMAQVMGGFSLGKADILRRGMGKKKASVVDAMYPLFVEGAKERDVPEQTANEVWEMMAKFAGYGFNKSHSAAYSVVAYQTAYLKANYPAAYMAAALTNVMDTSDKLSSVLDEVRRMGLEVHPPCVNSSVAHFTVEDGAIRFGLGAIKGVGLGAIEALLRVREEHGAFETLFDLTEPLDLRTCGKKALEALAMAGAMDQLEGHRAQLCETVELAVQHAQREQANQTKGFIDMFAVDDGDGNSRSARPVLPQVEHWRRSAKLKNERELLGFYVSEHPLDLFRAEADAFATADLSQAEELEEEIARHKERDDPKRRRGPARNPEHTFLGLMTEIKRVTTRKGRPMAFAQMEDLEGQGELVIFSSQLDRLAQHLQIDEPVLVRGNVEVQGGAVKVLVSDIVPMWKVRAQMVEALTLRVDADLLRESDVRTLRQLCDAHPGDRKLYIDLASPDLPGGRQRLLCRQAMVDLNDPFMLGLTQLFGRDGLHLTPVEH